jgi:hypothetical protein
VHILTDQRYGMITQTSLGSIYSTISFSKDLEFRTQLGANVVSRNINEYNAKQLYGISDGQNGTANVTNDRETFWSLENYLTYNKRFAESHAINALLGISWQATNFFSNTSHAENFVTDFYGNNNMGSGSKSITVGSSRNRSAFNSYFGRLNYAFQDKYLVTFTGRVDGSSKFGDNHKFAFFPFSGTGLESFR